MAEVTFNYKGIETIIQCNINDKMKDIINKYLIRIKKGKDNLYYLYNGNKINYELTFNEQANDLDKNRNKMNIIVTDTDEDPNKKREIISKDIICPECKENIIINFNNYKINLNGCKNNHNIYNILLNKFEDTQKIDLNNIICEVCKKINKNNTHNNEFYICNTCNKNICPLCKSIHNKNHIIINYDDKNYICKLHNDSFTKYCNTCNKDICIICENEHDNHNTIDFRKLLINKNDLIKSKDDLNNIINKYKYKINIIKEIFDRLINTFDLYYKINNDIIIIII